MQKFAVIGLGRFGQGLAKALTASITDAEIIAIDRNPKLVEQIRDQVTLAVRLDSTDEEALKSQGISEVDAVIVGIGDDFESSALTVAILKTLGVRCIIARAESEIQGKILNRVGADEIAYPERESAMRWAHRLTLPNLARYIELGEGHSVVYTSPPRRFHHKTLKELDLRNKHGINLIAIERRVSIRTGSAAPDDADAQPLTTPIISVPDADTSILPGDVLIVVGSNESLSRLPRE